MSTLVPLLPANEITGANAGQRLEFDGKSRVGLSPRPGVAQLVVRRRAERTVLGRFEQKATKKTKSASIFVSFVSFCRIWTPRRFAPMTQISFRVFRGLFGYVSSAVAGRLS